MILLTDAISQSSNFCWIVLDETTYYITAFAVDSNNVVIGTQQKTITTDFGWHPSANTVARYKFENDGNDYSGNSHNISWYGSPSYAISGGTKKALYLNGSTLGEIANLSGSYSNYTFNVWVKPTSTTVWQQIFWNANSYNNAWEKNVYVNWNGTSSEQASKQDFGFQYRAGSGSYINLYGTQNRVINTWYNICVIGSSSGVKGYLNGTLIFSGSSSSLINLVSGGNCIGGAHNRSQGTYSNFLTGYLSEFIFENGNWSESDLVKYVNKTKSRYGL